MSLLRCLLLPIVLTSCTGGADVFDVQDAGPTECERPVAPPTHTGAVWTNDDLPPSLTMLCVPPLEVGAGGMVQCELRERLPTSGPSTNCEDLPGRIHVRTELDETGALRQVCELRQVGSGDGVGWHYEPAADVPGGAIATQCGTDGQAIVFAGFDLVGGTIVDWVCTPQNAGDTNGLGDPCGPDIAGWGGECGIARPPAPGNPFQIWCDFEVDRCGVRCTGDADCEAAGFPGERCAERGFCVITSCAAE